MTKNAIPDDGRTELRPAAPIASNALGADFAWVIVELAADGILVSDDDGRIMAANRHIEALFGYDRDELIGARVETLLPHRHRGAHETHRASYTAAPALRPMGVGLQLFGCHADGSEFPIEVSLSPAATEQGIATVVIIRDVTQQRELELAARDTSALEQSEQIAAELHDRVISRLFSSGLTLGSILSRSDLDDHLQHQLGEVIDELDTAVREIRNTVFGTEGHDYIR